MRIRNPPCLDCQAIPDVTRPKQSNPYLAKTALPILAIPQLARPRHANALRDCRADTYRSKQLRPCLNRTIRSETAAPYQTVLHHSAPRLDCRTNPRHNGPNQNVPRLGLFYPGALRNRQPTSLWRNASIASVMPASAFNRRYLPKKALQSRRASSSRWSRQSSRLKAL